MTTATKLKAAAQREATASKTKAATQHAEIALPDIEQAKTVDSGIAWKQDFKVTARTASGTIDISRLVESLTWQDQSSDELANINTQAALVGTMQMRKPALHQYDKLLPPALSATVEHGVARWGALGVVITCQVGSGRTYTPIWAMRVTPGYDASTAESVTLSDGTWTMTLADDLWMLAQSQGDFKYVKSKGLRKKGWRCDQIALDVCRNYKVPVKQLVQGTSFFELPVHQTSLISPLTAITLAYQAETRRTGKTYIIRWAAPDRKHPSGALEVVPMRRNKNLLRIRRQLIDAVLSRSQSADFCTVLEARGSLGGKSTTTSGDTILMYDTTKDQLNSIPKNAAAVASYVDNYGGYAQAVKQFPNAQVVSISVTPGNNVSADIYDVESKGKTVAETIDAIAKGRAKGAYGGASDLGAIKAGLAKRGVKRSAYVLWVSAWPGTGPYVPPGYDAHQYTNNPRKGKDGPYDTSAAKPSFFSALATKAGASVGKGLVHIETSALGVKRFGFIRKVVNFGPVSNERELETLAKRALAQRLAPIRTAELTHPGIATLRRGDAIRIDIPEEGYAKVKLNALATPKMPKSAGRSKYSAAALTAAELKDPALFGLPQGDVGGTPLRLPDASVIPKAAAFTAALSPIGDQGIAFVTSIAHSLAAGSYTVDIQTGFTDVLDPGEVREQVDQMFRDIKNAARTAAKAKAAANAAAAPGTAGSGGGGGTGTATIDNVVAAAQLLDSLHVPYLYGGGHGSGALTNAHPGGLDCSGSVSWVLHRCGMFPSSTAVTSGSFASSWGQAGQGSQFTVWANGGHVFFEVNAPGAGHMQGNTAPGPGFKFYAWDGRSTAGFQPRRWPGL